MSKTAEEILAKAGKPAPAVGTKLTLDFGPENRATWPFAGVVMAVVDKGACFVVRRWIPGRGHHYQLVMWSEWMQFPYRVLKVPRPALPEGAEIIATAAVCTVCAHRPHLLRRRNGWVRCDHKQAIEANKQPQAPL